MNKMVVKCDEEGDGTRDVMGILIQESADALKMPEMVQSSLSPK
jgi:hypothetical protein